MLTEIFASLIFITHAQIYENRYEKCKEATIIYNTIIPNGLLDIKKKLEDCIDTYQSDFVCEGYVRQAQFWLESSKNFEQYIKQVCPTT